MHFFDRNHFSKAALNESGKKLRKWPTKSHGPALGIREAFNVWKRKMILRIVAIVHGVLWPSYRLIEWRTRVNPRQGIFFVVTSFIFMQNGIGWMELINLISIFLEPRWQLSSTLPSIKKWFDSISRHVLILKSNRNNPKIPTVSCLNDAGMNAIRLELCFRLMSTERNPVERIFHHSFGCSECLFFFLFSFEL